MKERSIEREREREEKDRRTDSQRGIERSKSNKFKDRKKKKRSEDKIMKGCKERLRSNKCVTIESQENVDGRRGR